MSWLAVMPKAGHAINLEDPGLFNQLVQDFLVAVETGGFKTRDPIHRPIDVRSKITVKRRRNAP